MKILVTGASGGLGRRLTGKLLEQGHEVWGLFRQQTDYLPAGSHFIPCLGDVTLENLGLYETDWEFEACYHLAGTINLSPIDKDNIIRETNLYGTAHVIQFCERYQIPHLYFCSTAFASGLRNPYEQSKSAADLITSHSKIPEVTIFKPSLVLGCGRQHFSTFVSLLISFHRRAEIIRRRIEGTLRLPVIEPGFRIHGNPQGLLNLVTADAVTTEMVRIQRAGTFWLTNPEPPSLSELAGIVGDFCLINLSFEKEFAGTPFEAGFQRLTRSFQPYLQGDVFPSNMPYFRLTRADIEKEMLQVLHRR